jgi:threonine dehydratase
VSDLVTLREIEEARAALPAVVRHTPVVPFARRPAETGSERLFLKLENLQVTGAYKVRAAFTMLRALPAGSRQRGIVVVSSGNFAQAFAFAGREMGIPIAVVMLATTSPYKIESTRELGAHVDLYAGPPLARQRRVEELARERGMDAIDTWEERPITAGHGSIGIEIMGDIADLQQVLVPVSSGGLAAGVATAVKSINRNVRVIGVQPIRANAAYVSLQQGMPTAIDYWDSIADGLSARRPGEFPFAHLQRYLDDIVLVEEREIARAHVAMKHRAKIIAEPAGAVAAAAFLSERVDTTLRTVAIVSGGNLTAEVMATMDTMAVA